MNQFLVTSGLLQPLVRILFSETLNFIELVQPFFPLMVLPLISASENLPLDVISTVCMLEANRLQLFAKISLPLSPEGLIIESAPVFVGSLTVYVTAAILADLRF